MNLKLPLLTGALALSLAVVPAVSADDGEAQLGFHPTKPHTPRTEAVAEGLGMDVEAHRKHFKPRKRAGAYLAEQFGISTDELRAEFEAGKTVEELAEEYGVDLNEYKKFKHSKKKRRGFTSLAERIGMTPSELTDAVQPGENLKEYLEANGYDHEQLRQDIKDEHEANRES